jgi:biopolymer transport protein ExbB/TolQ
MQGLSEALIPAALGLLVAVLAYWGYELSNEVEVFHVKMKNASLDLMNYLSHRKQFPS